MSSPVPRPREWWRVVALVSGLLATACQDSRRTPLTAAPSAPILLFTGAGTSPGDVAALEALLARHHLAYSTADSAQLETLDAARLARFRLLVIPGGNFLSLGHGLGPATSAKLHGAIHGGLNYLGLCAGAFLAGTIADAGLELTGTRFQFYAASGRGERKAMVPLTTARGGTLEQYWEDGPQLEGWGTPIARYPDGTPAIVEGRAGKGWAILSGVHPEAPEAWRRGLAFTTPPEASEAFAVSLVEAALEGRSLLGD